MSSDIGTYHVGSLGESHGYPALCGPLHVDIHVVRVALVSVDAYEGVAGTGITPLRLTEYQGVVSCRSSL